MTRTTPRTEGFNLCQHCRQPAIVADINGAVCADCWDEGLYEDEPSSPEDAATGGGYSPYNP